MQVKLKNSNGLSRFMLAHGEKLGMAAVATVAGLLIYFSLGRDKLGDDKQPPILSQKAQAAEQHVQAVTWESIPVPDKTIAANVIIPARDGVITPVKPGDFPPIASPNPSPIPPILPRKDPVLLTLIEPEANGGAGIWMSGDQKAYKANMLKLAQKAQEEEKRREAEREEEMEDEGDRRGRRRGRDRDREGYGEGMDFGAGSKSRDGAIVVQPTGGSVVTGVEDIRNRFWVTVLAKVPIKQQYQMYEDALANARGFNPSVDIPEYLGYQIQRMEITPGGAGKWIALTDVTARGVNGGIEGVMKTWPLRTPEVVNPKYIHPILTYPLPPMVIREWGKEVTHSELPLPSPDDYLEEMAPPEAEPTPGEAAEGDNAFEAAAASRAAPPVGGYGERGGYEMRGAGGIGRASEMGAPRSGYGGYARPGGIGRPGEGGMMGGMMGGGDLTLGEYVYDPKNEFILFRYFDSRVEPGRQYKYRVRLVLVDVNAMASEKTLDPAVIARKQKGGKFLFTEWSEETNVATVPQPGLVYVAGAKPASAGNPNAEPEAELIIKSLEPVHAAEIGISSMFTRGAVLDLRQKAQVIWSSLFKPEEGVESPDFDFYSGLTLLDFDGGEKLTANMQAPARALLMNAGGRMVLQSELDDDLKVRQFEAVIEADKAAAANRNEEGRGGGGIGRPR